MNAEFLSDLQLLPLRQRAALEEALAELLLRSSKDGPLTVRSARDRFSAVNRLAREGQAQLVRGDPGDETVLVSVKDLATMMQSAASSLTFGSILAASGFEPTGERLVLEEGFTPEAGLVLPDESYHHDRAVAAA